MDVNILLLLSYATLEKVIMYSCCKRGSNTATDCCSKTGRLNDVEGHSSTLHVWATWVEALQELREVVKPREEC